MLRLSFRQVVILVTAVIAIAYLAYRLVFTLNLTTTYSVFASVLLYLGELYGVINMLLYFVQVWEVYEPPQKPVLPGRTVDVFVPTYNEDPDMLRVTIQACVAMDYPHKTYLCDDGGTDARCNDPEKGPAARERAEKLKAMCEELGAIYTTRPKNNHAKAGNLNYVFEKTDGEFLIIFDADHVPEPHFITRLIGYFADEKLAFVQTPHAFYNFDSFQARLNHKARKYWEEGQLFYHVIQPGRNRHGCPIFAGSAAMFRRSALQEVGWIATETITEDMHTGLRMHQRGWTSLGISERMVAGAAAQDVTTFHSQRLRWGEGNISVVFYDNPLTMRGLSLGQRLCYAATILNWASGLFKLAIYLSPLMMLFTGVPPVAEFTWTLAVMMVVYMTACILGTKVAGNGYGSFWYSELFTMASFWTQVRGTMKALFWRKFQMFVVTAKRGRQSKSIWPFIRPQVYLMVFSATAILWAWSRLMLGVSDDPFKPMLATFWAFFHMLLAYLVVRRAYWPDDRRYSTRHTAYLPVSYKVGENGEARRGLGFTSDLNDQGSTLIGYQEVPVGTRLRMTIHGAGRMLDVEGEIRSCRPLTPGGTGPEGAAGGFRHGVQFVNRQQAQIDALNLLCLHHAVPKLYRYYAEGHTPIVKRVFDWAARHFRFRRHGERREYRLPLLMFPMGLPEMATYAVTENVSRSSMAVLLAQDLNPGVQVRYSIASPLGEIAGVGHVLRSVPREYAARTFFLVVIEFDRFDEEGRRNVYEMFRVRTRKRMGPLLEPVKAPMPVPMNKPLATGAAVALLLLGAEYAVFRVAYREDFFLRDIAYAERPLTAEEVERVDGIYRDTMTRSWPGTDRLVLLGHALSRMDRPAELAEVTRRLAPRDPNNLDLQVALAHAHDQREDFEQAEAEFRRLLAAVDRGDLPQSRREELLAGAARSTAHAGDVDAAGPYFRDLIAAFPDRLGYRHEYAGALLAARRPKEAALLYEGVEPDHEGRVLLVLIHTAAKDWPAAEREARALLKDEPDDAGAQGLLADVLSARGDHRQAKGIYERLLKSGRDDLRIGVQLAHASLWAKDYDEALDRFQAVLDRHPDTAGLVRQYPQVVRGYVNAAASATNLGDVHRPAALRLYDQAVADRSPDSVYLARLGWVLHRLEEFDKSAVLLDQALALDPADQGLKRQLAGVLVSAGRAEEALKLLAEGSSTVEGRLLLIDVYLASKNFDAAEKECRAILKDDPSLKEARVRLANVLSWKGEYDRSIELWERLIRDYPGDVELAVRLADTTLWSGDYPTALKRFQELLAADFERPSLWYGFVDAASPTRTLSAEQVRLAHAIAERALAGDHRTNKVFEEARRWGRTVKEAPFLTRLAWVLLDRVKDPVRAAAVLDQALAVRNAAPAERKELAGVLAAAGRYESALRQFEGLTLEPKDRVRVARIHAAMANFPAAIEQCREALRRSPLDHEAQRVLADALSWDGQYKESLAIFDALLEASAADTDLMRRRAEVTLWSGDAARALALFAALVEGGHDREEFWPGFIEAAGRLDRLTDDQAQLAREVLGRPQIAASRDAELLARAGWVLHRHLNDRERATELLSRAVSARPKDPAVLSRIALALNRTGQSARGLALLDEALALKPKKPTVVRELAGVLTATGRFKDAQSLYADLAVANPRDLDVQARLAEVTLWAGNTADALEQLAAVLKADFARPALWRSFVDAASTAPSLNAEQLRLAVRIATESPPELSKDDRAVYLSRLAWALYREGEKSGGGDARLQAARLLDTLPFIRPADAKSLAEVAGVLAAAGRGKDALPWLEDLARSRPGDAEVQRQLAEVALGAGAYERSLAELQKLLDVNFDQSRLWVNFIDAAAGAKKGALTDQQLRLLVRLAGQEAPDSAPDKLLYLSRLAWALVREGRTKDAGPILDKATAAVPKDPKVLLELAGVLTAAGRFKEALASLEQLAAADPRDVELQGRVAEVALWGGDRVGGLDRLTRLLDANIELSQFWGSFVDAASSANKGELTPEQVRLAVKIAERPVPATVVEPALYASRLGWVLHREGRTELADPLLARAVAEAPNKPEVRRELGGVLTAAGKYQEGLKMFEGLNLTPDDRLSLVVLHAAAKQFKQAEDQCRHLLKERPDDAKGRRWLADVTLWGGQYERALTLYQEQLNANLNQPELWSGFIEAAVKAAALTDGQAKLVLEIADRLEAAKVQDAVFAARVGLLLHRDAEGRTGFPRAAAAIVGAVAAPPVPVVAASALAAERGRQSRAADWIERADRERPKDPTLLARLAWTFHLAGYESRSASALDAAVAMNPREPAARREVGDVMVATGRLRQALSWFEALAASESRDAELQARLAEVTVWAGDFAKGLARLEKLLLADLGKPHLWRTYADAAAAVVELTDSQIELARRIASERTPDEWGASGNALFRSRLAWGLYREGERTGRGEMMVQANRLLDVALAIRPSETAVRLELAGVLTAAHRFGEALALYECLEKEAPDNAAVRAALARVTLWAGHHEPALRRLESLLLADFRQPELWRLYAEAAGTVKRLTPSQRDLLVRIAGRAADAAGETALLQATVAAALLREGKARSDDELIRRSEVLFDQVMAFPPAKPSERRALAGLLAGAGRTKAALEMARGTDTTDAAGRALMTDLYAADHDMEAAEREARELVRLLPNDWEARFKLANVLGWGRKYTEATELYRGLGSDRPDDSRIPVRLAQMSLWGGKYDDALGRYLGLLEKGHRQEEVLTGYVDAAASAKVVRGEANRKAALLIYDSVREQPPSDPEALGRLAWVMSRAHEHALSIGLLERALSLDPQSRELRLRLAQALTAAGQFAEADKHYRQLLRSAPARFAP